MYIYNYKTHFSIVYYWICVNKADFQIDLTSNKLDKSHLNILTILRVKHFIINVCNIICKYWEPYFFSYLTYSISYLTSRNSRTMKNESDDKGHPYILVIYWCFITWYVSTVLFCFVFKTHNWIKGMLFSS